MLDASSKRMRNLTDEEKRRNGRGDILMLLAESHPAFPALALAL